MKLELDKFNGYLVQFFRDVLAPSARSASTKFRIGWALGSGKVGIGKGDEWHRSFVATGVIGDDGMVDVDQLRRCVDGGLQLAGDLRIDQLGVNVERPEIDKFFRLLETGSLG